MSTEKTRNKTYIFTSLTLGGLRLRLLEKAYAALEAPLAAAGVKPQK